MSWTTHSVPPSTVRKTFLRTDVRFGCELGLIYDLPVVYNLVDFGEISDHAKRSLDVTAVKEMWFAAKLLGNKPVHLLVHPPGRVVRQIEART